MPPTELCRAASHRQYYWFCYDFAADIAGIRPHGALDSKGRKPLNGGCFAVGRLVTDEPPQAWVRSSAAEHYLHTVGVTGSIPVAPTTLFK